MMVASGTKPRSTRCSVHRLLAISPEPTRRAKVSATCATVKPACRRRRVVPRRSREAGLPGRIVRRVLPERRGENPATSDRPKVNSTTRASTPIVAARGMDAPDERSSSAVHHMAITTPTTPRLRRATRFRPAATAPPAPASSRARSGPRSAIRRVRCESAAQLGPAPSALQ